MNLLYIFGGIVIFLAIVIPAMKVTCVLLP